MRTLAPERAKRSRAAEGVEMRGLPTRARPPRPALRPLLATALALAALALAATAQAAEQRPAVEKELPTLARTANDALARSLARGHVSEAEYAFERALALFRPGRARRLFGDVEKIGPHDATPILRDLAARLDELSPRKRAVAERVLARPTS